MKLFFNALIKFICGVVLVGLLLFWPAGTFEFVNAWIFIGALFIPMFLVMIYLAVKKPELLEKRIKAKEKENVQKTVVGLTALIFITAFIIAGLDFKYDWSKLPMVVTYISTGVLFIAYGLYVEVLRENEYLSRNVEVQENQKVVDTGLYGVVRHPMYLATIFLYLSIPFILGSIYSFIIFLPFVLLIITRIKNEEKVLEEGLEGYIEYKKKVKYRIIPFIW